MQPNTCKVGKAVFSGSIIRQGESGATMAADGGDCERVLGEFVKSGIHVDALAARLQDEGAESFVKSWNELLAVIALKKTA
jgi:transaldolase